MSQAKMLIAAAALAAGGSIAHGATSWNESVQFNDLSPVRVAFPGFGDRGADDGVVDNTFDVTNFVGLDLASMNIKINPHPDETYGPGEFESIVFDMTVIPTAQESGSDVGSYTFDDDKNLFWEFAPGEYETGEVVRFTFTILTPHMKLFEMEFEPNVPTPGTLAIAGLAGVAGLRRRR